MASTVAITVPVGRPIRTRPTNSTLTPLFLATSRISSPRESWPTAEIKDTETPNCARCAATLNGAPPACLPEGRQSQSISPKVKNSVFIRGKVWRWQLRLRHLPPTGETWTGREVELQQTLGFSMLKCVSRIFFFVVHVTSCLRGP